MKIVLIYLIAGLSVVLIPFVHTLNSECITATDYPCPPYHKETRQILQVFLTSEGYREYRERLNIGEEALDEISYLEVHEICKDFDPDKSDRFLVTYYKSKDFYFIIANYLRHHIVAKGDTVTIDTTPDHIAIFDKNLEYLGGLLL